MLYSTKSSESAPNLALELIFQHLHMRVIKRENKYSDQGRFNVCSSVPRF